MTTWVRRGVMRLARALPLWGLSGAIAASGLGTSAPAPTPIPTARLATTTSYLEAAVHDLLGDTTPVLRLAEPGTCPGHFDLRPSQVVALRQCAVLLRFDFQRALDARLSGRRDFTLRTAEVIPAGGMGQPETYLSACAQTARHLMEAGLLPRSTADTRLAAIAARLELLRIEATQRIQAAGLERAPVLASARQQDFARWLGLHVVATFRPADVATPREVQQAVEAGGQAGVQVIVANRPEGRQTADALGERLRARVVVFDNFPRVGDRGPSFDRMVRDNVSALVDYRGP